MIVLLASTSTVAMYSFERLKYSFEDDPQAASSQTVEETASLFRGASICLLASSVTVAMDSFARTTLWTNQMGYISLVAQCSCREL